MNAADTTVSGSFEVRDLTPEDKGWVQRVLRQYWATTTQVSRGRLLQADELPGIAAVRDGEEVGLLTYEIVGEECEIVTHNSMAGHGGIGSCLLAGVRAKAREAGCRRLWCTTTNDNTPALRFYQRREFELVQFYKDAVAQTRALKPEVPDTGIDGIPIRHELELEYVL